PAAMQLVRLATLPVFGIVVLLTPLLTRVPAPARLIAALATTTVTVAAAGLTDGPVTLTVTLAVTTAAVTVIAPAMVETIGQESPAGQRGSATAVYGFALFIGASLAAPTATLIQSAGFATGALV